MCHHLVIYEVLSISFYWNGVSSLYLNSFSRCYITVNMNVQFLGTTCGTHPVSLVLLSPSICSRVSDLGVWKWWGRGVPEVASSGGHGRSSWSLVRGGVSHLPLANLQQPDGVLLVWRGGHFQPLENQPQTNQSDPQQPADPSHLSHTGALKKQHIHNRDGQL